MSKKMKLLMAFLAVVAVAALVIAAVGGKTQQKLRTDLLVTQGKLSAAQSQLDAEKKAHEASVAEKQGELDALNAAHEEAVAALTAEKDAAIAEAEAKAEAEAAAKAAAEAEAAVALEAEQTAHAETKTALEALQGAYAVLEAEKDALAGKVDELTAALEKAEEDKVFLNRTIDAGKASHELTMANLEARRAELEQAREKIADLLAEAEKADMLIFADGEEVSLTLSIYDGDGNKKFSCPVPFEGEDMNIVTELLAVDEGAFGYEVRIVEGSGAGSQIRTVKVTFDAVMGLIK